MHPGRIQRNDNQGTVVLPVSNTAQIVSLVLFLVLPALPALSDARIKQLPSTEQEIRIDGVLDEDAWQDAIQIDIDVETKPGENIPARVKTIAYLVEDGDHLYVAFDAQDPDPSSIRAYLRDRDAAYDDSGRMIEREAEFNFRIRGPMQSRIYIGGLTRDILFDAVLFKENRISFFTEFQPTGGLRLGIRSHYGDKVDFANTQLGEELRMAPFINWNVNRHLLLRLDSNFLKLDSKSGPNIFDAQVHDLRMTWQFSVRSFIRLTAQFQDVKRTQDEYIDPVDARTRDVGRQLLYSYKLNP